MIKNTTTYKNAKIVYLSNQITSKKPTIVCLHGFLENKSIFNFLFTDNYFFNYNLIAIDLLGHAESESIGYIHSMEDQAFLINHIITENSLNKITLIGHSMGGYVALAFAELFPKQTLKIFLINSCASADSDLKKANRLRGIELVKKNAAVFIQMAIGNLFDEETKNKNEKIINELKQTALNNTTQGVIANMQGMLNRKDRNFLLTTTNIFFIAGTKDAIIPIQEIKNEIINKPCKLYQIDGYHMLWVEQPNAIKKILKENL